MNSKTMLGVLVSAIAIFMFGALYWGVNPLPYQDLLTVADEATAQAQMKEMFPENGTYFVPDLNQPPEALEAAYTRGPTGFFYIDHDAPVPGDPSMFIGGFVLDLLTTLVLALLLANSRGMSAHLKMGALAGIAAVLVTDLADVIWWNMSLDWKIHQSVYHFLMFLIGAAVLSPFMPKEE